MTLQNATVFSFTAILIMLVREQPDVMFNNNYANKFFCTAVSYSNLLTYMAYRAYYNIKVLNT